MGTLIRYRYFDLSSSQVKEVDVDEYPLTRDLMNRLASGGQMNAKERKLWALLDGRKSLDQQNPAVLKRVEAGLRRMYQGMRSGEDTTRGMTPTTTPDGKRGGGRKAFTFTQFEAQQRQIQERAIDAEPSASTVDDVREARAELALIRRALNELDLTRDQRVALKQRRNALLADLASIEAADEQEAQAIRDKRAAAAKAAREKREKREKAEQEAEAKHMERVMKRAQDHYDRMAKLTKGTNFATRAGLRKAALRGIDPKTGRPKVAGDDDKPLTEADIRRMQFDFLTGLHGALAQFGGNVGDTPADYGMMGTQSQIQTAELREQTDILRGFTRATSSPATGYARTELTTRVYGYGF